MLLVNSIIESLSSHVDPKKHRARRRQRALIVYSLARWDQPTSSDPARDFDLASFGIVKVLAEGRTGTTYPGVSWEPKAAFHALADYGRARAAGAGRRTKHLTLRDD